jgi:putative sterol carrier protein
MSAQNFIEIWLTVLDRISKDPRVLDEIKDLSMAIVLYFQDLDAAFSISIAGGELRFQEGESSNYESKVTFDSKTFEGVVTGEVNPMKAMQKRKIMIDGPIGPMMNLLYLLPPMKDNLRQVKEGR